MINGVQDEYSYTYKIIEACIAGDLQAIFSHKIKKEYLLLANRLITDEEYLNTLDDFYESGKLVNPTNRNNLITDDPEDNKFIDAAEESTANYIISEDHHLLDLENFGNTKILEPADFWSKYQNELSDEDDGASAWKDWAKNIGI